MATYTTAIAAQAPKAVPEERPAIAAATPRASPLQSFHRAESNFYNAVVHIEGLVVSAIASSVVAYRHN